MIKIKRYKLVEPVYDITVEKAGNFYANGVLVHNCSEISLPVSRDESFVCDLMSINLVHYEEWKDTDAVKTAIYFLDAVMTEYIDKASKVRGMEHAVNFAKRHRALGLGVLGWHSYLQSRMIPFESFEAKMKNVEIAKNIRDSAEVATKELAVKYGEPEILKGYGRRNTTLLAIAPTVSSSVILGQVSQSIEPLDDNYFVNITAKGKYTYKNPHLKPILSKYGKDDAETWKDILEHGGSVQHLDFLSELEKDVFKTFGEISQKEIIIQAAARQKYIDQSQSLNLKIDPKTPMKGINSLILTAHELGVKTLYYHKGTNPAQQLSRDINSCKSCEA
jgi:ribonucleoside-diphosphate reductase alpha chain